jgi:glycosyltransferase involved in cell wall biosynthesis
VLTQSDIPLEPGLVVQRGVTAHSAAWRAAWAAADVFVFPSRLETFGIVLIEALAFGVPVIASRTGAAADVLEEGRHGLLLDELSADALARALREVLENPAAAQARAQAGLARVRRDFDLTANAERLARHLHAAAGG